MTRGAGGGSCRDDDACLVAARHDPEPFLEFYDRRYRRVSSFFYRRTLCPETTADLTSETFARVWDGRVKFDPQKGTAVAWTMGIAANLYRQWSARGAVATAVRERLRVRTPTLVVEDYEHIESLVDMASLWQQLASALDTLSPKVRDALVLRVAMDLPYPEVAARLGCTVETARTRVNRGLRSVQGTMGAIP